FVLVGAGEPGRGSTAGHDDDAVAARLAAGRVLELVQHWLRLEELAAARLVIVTAGAVEAVPGEGGGDLPGAACWGVVRWAQAENPGRIVLADLPAGSVSISPVSIGPVSVGPGSVAIALAGSDSGSAAV